MYIPDALGGDGGTPVPAEGALFLPDHVDVALPLVLGRYTGGGIVYPAVIYIPDALGGEGGTPVPAEGALFLPDHVDVALPLVLGRYTGGRNGISILR